MTRLETYEGWNKWNQHYWLRAATRTSSSSSSRRSSPSRTRPSSSRTRSAGRSTPTPRRSSPPSLRRVFRTKPASASCADAHSLPGARHPRHATTPSDPTTPARRSPSWPAGLVTLEGSGHCPQVRDPVKVNLLLAISSAARRRPTLGAGRAASAPKRALYISSPIGLGHAQPRRCDRRRAAQAPPGSRDRLARAASGDGVLEARRRADPPGERAAGERVAPHRVRVRRARPALLPGAGGGWTRSCVANFMVFHDLVATSSTTSGSATRPGSSTTTYTRTRSRSGPPTCWLTDFVGWLPMPDGGEQEAFLTADYNAEMIEHIARYPRLRDRAIFVGEPDDVVAGALRTRAAADPRLDRAALRLRRVCHGLRPGRFRAIASGSGPSSASRPDEQVCIVTVGGSGVGADLLRRVIDAFPEAKQRVPELRMIVVAGPRIDPASLPAHDGLEVRALRPRPLPPPGRVRPRRRAGWPDHLDGADRQPETVPLLPARPPLRAELPRPPPARALRGRTGDGLRPPTAPRTSPPRSRRRSAARSTTGPSTPAAPPGQRR